MNVTVNGHARLLEHPTTVAELVADEPKRAMAVAVNGSVVPASMHAATALRHGDVVEIVTAVAGG